MAKKKEPFYPPSKDRGVVPCPQWTYFSIDEIKAVVVRLLGPPVRSPTGRYAIHCFDRSDSKVKVLEGPHELFEQFAAYDRHSGFSASGSEAPDFHIALCARPFRFLVAPMRLTVLTEREQVEMICHSLDLGSLYKTGERLHIVEVSARLGVWPKPFWPTKFQEKWNAASVEQLTKEGIVLRFPSAEELRDPNRPRG